MVAAVTALHYTSLSRARRHDGGLTALLVYLSLVRFGAVVWTVICELTFDFLLMLVELRSHNLPGDVGEVELRGHGLPGDAADDRTHEAVVPPTGQAHVNIVVLPVR